MTLIYTEASASYILMIADSALTQDVRLNSMRTVTRVLTGFQKLHQIPVLNAGISMWGLGSLLRQDKDAIPMDVWLKDFISRKGFHKTLDEFAKDLADELHNLIGQPRSKKDVMGFHIAGFVEENGKKVPAIYHVRNCETADGKNYELHKFEPSLDFPPAQILESKKPLGLHNGDYLPFSILDYFHNFALLEIENMTGRKISGSRPSDRAKYFSALVRFVAELYVGTENQEPTIGGSIHTLLIWPNNTMNYEVSTSTAIELKLAAKAFTNEP